MTRCTYKTGDYRCTRSQFKGSEFCKGHTPKHGVIRRSPYNRCHVCGGSGELYRENSLGYESSIRCYECGGSGNIMRKR